MLKFETVITHSYYFEKDNLLFVKLKEDPEISIPNLILNNEQNHAVLGEKVTKAIFDIRHLQFTHISKEVMSYVADSPYGKYQQAEAFLISGLGQKMIANFYLKVMKPKVRSKFFNKLEAALEWHEVQDKEILLEKLDRSN